MNICIYWRGSFFLPSPWQGGGAGVRSKNKNYVIVPLLKATNRKIMLNNVETKYINWALILLCVFLGVLTLTGLRKLQYIGKEIYPQRTIMASGEGESFAIPDIASFSFTVTEASESVETAQGLLDQKIAQALKVLKDAGVEEKDTKTTSYNVYPKYEWEQIVCITYPCPQGQNKLVGYEVSQSVTIKIRKVDQAGDVVSKVGAVNVSNISGLEFTVDDREKYVAEAREAAIKKAKENAEKLADDLGVRLGKMMYFNESGNYMPQPY